MLSFSSLTVTTKGDQPAADCHEGGEIFAPNSWDKILGREGKKHKDPERNPNTIDIEVVFFTKSSIVTTN